MCYSGVPRSLLFYERAKVDHHSWMPLCSIFLEYILDVFVHSSFAKLVFNAS